MSLTQSLHHFLWEEFGLNSTLACLQLLPKCSNSARKVFPLIFGESNSLMEARFLDRQNRFVQLLGQSCRSLIFVGQGRNLAHDDSSGSNLGNLCSIVQFLAVNSFL